MAYAGHGVSEHLVCFEVRVGLGHGGKPGHDIHNSILLVGDLLWRNVSSPARGDDIREGIMLVDSVLFGHLNEVGDSVPPGFELDIDLSESVLHLLLKADKSPLGPDDVKAENHDQSDDDNCCHFAKGLLVSDFRYPTTQTRTWLSKVMYSSSKFSS